MKLLARMPGSVSRCTCGVDPGHPCDVHRERAVIEFKVTLPGWWWKVWYRCFDRDTRRWW